MQVEIEEEQVSTEYSVKSSLSINRSDSEEVASNSHMSSDKSQKRRKSSASDGQRRLIYNSFSGADDVLPKSFSMRMIKEMPWQESEELDHYKNVLHLLVICVSELSAGTMLFQDVLGVNRLPSFNEFVSFVKTMEIYGAGYSDDVDYFRYNKRNIETHAEAMVKQL